MKGTLLGVIKKSTMEVLGVPLSWMSSLNSNNNVREVIPDGLTFTELLYTELIKGSLSRTWKAYNYHDHKI